MRGWLILGLAVLLVAGAVWSAKQASQGDRELPVYVLAAGRMVQGEEIYRPQADHKPFTYPPFFALPFVPFTWLPDGARAPLFFAINLGLLLLVLRWLQAWARTVGQTRPWLTWLLVALLVGRHLVSPFENQSHDLVILLAVTWCAREWSTGRRTLAGVAAGVGAACKATPLLLLGLFGLRRALPALLGLFAAAAVLTWLPDLLAPRADGLRHVVAWYEGSLRSLTVGGAAQGVWNTHSFLNQSLPGTLTRLTTPITSQNAFVFDGIALLHLQPATFRIVLLAAQAAVLGLLSWIALRGHAAVRAAADPVAAQREVGLGEVGAFACGMVLLSPMSSKAHFCVLLPAAWFAVRRLLATRDLLLGGWLLLAFALGSLTAKDVLGRELGNRLLAYGSVTWSALAMLLACLRALRLRPSAARLSG